MGNYNFSDMSVLVCDDSFYIRSLVKTFLAGFGVKNENLTEADNAHDGFTQFVDEDPDLIITDWNMNETSGLSLVHLIRWSEKSPNPFVPIIMLTGYTELDRIKQARDSGISGYLAKPVKATSLYKQLCQTVNDRRNFIRFENFFGPDRRVRKNKEFTGHDRRQAA